MIGVSQAGRRVAEAYDLHPWDEEHRDGIDPRSLLALAFPYGAKSELNDVVDFGCGTGRLLDAAGDSCGGRLVGTDISAASTAIAERRLARHGDRCQIITADLLELTPERVGEADLIYCTGVIYVLPPPVRDHLLALIGSCLRPGGIALISYAVGLHAEVRAHLGRDCRAVDSGGDPQERIRRGREAVDALRPAASRPSQFTRALCSAFNYFDRMSDEEFLAELLNEASESMSTLELDHALAPYGVGFATYVDFRGFEPWYSSSDRALMAERLDLTESYQHALFVKPLAPAAPPPPGRRAKPGPTELPVPVTPPPASIRFRLRRFARGAYWRVFRV